jgi:hypothetical protein
MPNRAVLFDFIHTAIHFASFKMSDRISPSFEEPIFSNSYEFVIIRGSIEELVKPLILPFRLSGANY